MDWIPKPGRALPDLDVPLLDILPIRSIPIGHPSAKICQKSLRNHPTPSSADYHDPSHRRHSPKSSYTHFEAKPPWVLRQTSWGESYYALEQEDSLEEDELNAYFYQETNNAASNAASDAATDAEPCGDELALSLWAEFPFRWGLVEEEDGAWLIVESQKYERSAALLQTWGFFSFILLVLGEKADRKLWQRRSNPSGHSLFVRWPRSLTDNLFNAPIDRDHPALELVLNVCWLLEDSGLAEIHPISTVCLSTRLLCDFLALDKEGGWDNHAFSERPNHTHTFWTKVDWRGSTFLMKCMIERGWCPSTVTKIMDSPYLGLLTAYYVFTMDSTRLVQQSSHAGCDTRLCRAHSVVLDGTYETRHVSSGCQCEMIGINTSDVCQIIAEGGTPLVEISEGPSGVALSVRKGKADEMYTAMSHVWSDGLGNPSHNALPRCQLSRLALRLRHFPENERYGWQDVLGHFLATGKFLPPGSIITLIPGVVALETGKWQFFLDRKLTTRSFWMDTLCIPVGEGDEVARCKLQAIDRMNYVYSAASRVLVLDPELLDIRLCASGMLETYARIAISPWFRRSWTFQEGILANNLHFQFADDIVRLANSNDWLDWKQAQLSEDPSPENASAEATGLVAWILRGMERSERFSTLDEGANPPHVLEKALYFHFDQTTRDPLRVFKSHFEEMTTSTEVVRFKRFASTWNELSTRTTTMDADVYLIFANVLGYSPSSVASLPIERRMQAIVWNVGLLPVGLLYNTGPRVDSSGQHRNRWVPSTPSKTYIASEKTLRDNDNRGAYRMLFRKSLRDNDNRWADRMLLRNNSIWIQAETAPSTFLLMFHKDVTRSEQLYVNAADMVFKVTAHLDSADTFHAEVGSTLCILCDISGDQDTWAGARIHITDWVQTDFDEDQLRGYDPVALDWPHVDVKNHFKKRMPLEKPHLRLTGIFDCPVSLTRIHEDEEQIQTIETPIAVLRYPQVAWKLEVKCDPFVDYQPMIERPTLRNAVPIVTALYGFVFLYWIVTTWALIYYVLRIIIAVQIGWHGTSHLYKASTVVFAVFPLPPFPEILFIADRIQQSATQPIDIAWTVLSIIFFYAGYISLVPLLLLGSSATRKAWTRAYDEDWPASSKTWLHRMTFTFGSRMSRAVATGRRALSGYYELGEVNDWIFLFLLAPVLSVRLLLKNPIYAIEKLFGWLYDFGRTGPFDDSTSERAWDARHCTFCRTCVDDSHYYKCALCDDIDICKSCLQIGQRCEGNHHYLVRCNDLRTVDKRGWLLQGWSSQPDEQGEVEYVNGDTGFRTHERPMVAEMCARTSRPRLRVDADGLYLSAGPDNRALVIWDT